MRENFRFNEGDYHVRRELKTRDLLLGILLYFLPVFLLAMLAFGIHIYQEATALKEGEVRHTVVYPLADAGVSKAEDDVVYTLGFRVMSPKSGVKWSYYLCEEQDAIRENVEDFFFDMYETGGQPKPKKQMLYLHVDKDGDRKEKYELSYSKYCKEQMKEADEIFTDEEKDAPDLYDLHFGSLWPYFVEITEEDYLERFGEPVYDMKTKTFVLEW